MNKPSPYLVPDTHGGVADPGKSLFVAAQVKALPFEIR